MKTHVATLARAHGSRIQHLLVPGTKQTQCGKDATLMARWAPADAKADSCVRETCQACRAEAEKPHRCTVCGSTAPHHVAYVLEYGICVI